VDGCLTSNVPAAAIADVVLVARSSRRVDYWSVRRSFRLFPAAATATDGVVPAAR
jgi:hypothetical protein